MQFRIEAFNVFNHTNFARIGITLPAFGSTSSTYGKVTSTRDPRIMQVAVKLNF